jgi:hypothetical protein
MLSQMESILVMGLVLMPLLTHLVFVKSLVLM